MRRALRCTSMALALVLMAWGCDKDGPDDSGNAEGSPEGVGPNESGATPENLYRGEALLARPELARRDIRGLLDQSRAYYERFFAFPPSVSLTPATVPCGEDGAAVNSADWAQPTWEALHFTPRDPHHYSYQYDRQGTGEGGGFLVTAIGDLDCDGELATFQRGARAQSDGIIASDREVRETNRDE